MTIKEARKEALSNDLVTNYLGYWTDNGAYHYYNPAPGSTYEETLVGVAEGLAQVGVPVRYLNLDSWWYSKGVDLGTRDWSPLPGFFPAGEHCNTVNFFFISIFPSPAGMSLTIISLVGNN
jgi:hypothetical protein